MRNSIKSGYILPKIEKMLILGSRKAYNENACGNRFSSEMKKSWTFETILKKSNFYFTLNQSRTREHLNCCEQSINIRLGGAPADDETDNGVIFVVRTPGIEEEVLFKFCNFFV